MEEVILILAHWEVKITGGINIDTGGRNFNTSNSKLDIPMKEVNIDSNHALEIIFSFRVCLNELASLLTYVQSGH